jgi:hypothetical protein
MTRVVSPWVEQVVWSLALAGLLLLTVSTFWLNAQQKAVYSALSPWRRDPFPQQSVAVSQWFDPSPHGQALAVEAPSLSPGGTKITYMERHREDDLMDYEVDSIWLAETVAGKWHKRRMAVGLEPFIGKTTTWFNPTFDATGNTLITGYAGFNQVMGIPWLPSLDKRLSRINVVSGQVTPWLSANDLGLGTEVLQHPKLSPNGQWLTFYTRKHKASRGIYLLHMPTRKLTHLSALDDKHPTWTPDGNRILFHHQRGGDALDPVPSHEPEQAYLGYFDVTLTPDGAVKGVKRVLLDPANTSANPKQYTFFKHPAQMPGSNWLVFHAKYRPTGKHVLCARPLAAGSPITQLTLVANGNPLKEAKHPANAVTTPVMVFLGKAQDHYAVYQLKGLPQ